MKYHHRRFLVDATLIGAIGITAVSIYVFQSHGVVHTTVVEFAHGFVYHASHWLVDVSGAEICAAVVSRLFAME